MTDRRENRSGVLTPEQVAMMRGLFGQAAFDSGTTLCDAYEALRAQLAEVTREHDAWRVRKHQDYMFMRERAEAAEQQVARLREAAEDFVAKVDRGEARSTDSYNKFKGALAATHPEVTP